VALIQNVSYRPKSSATDTDVGLVQNLTYDKMNALPVEIQSLWKEWEKPIVRMASEVSLINDRQESVLLRFPCAVGNSRPNRMQWRGKRRIEMKYSLGCQRSGIEITTRTQKIDF
jgi:hypothetical protein